MPHPGNILGAQAFCLRRSMATNSLADSSKRKKTPQRRSTCKIPLRLPRKYFNLLQGSADSAMVRRALDHAAARTRSPAANKELEKMKRSNWLRLTIGAVLVALGFNILINAQLRRSQLNAADYRITGPYTHKNLTVFLIHGQDRIKGKTFLTLQEALVHKKIVVYETKEVNELAIENRSNEEVYVQSGEIVKGGQQDRMLGVDLIVPPHSGKIPIAAFCVESGRWTKRGTEQATVFGSSSDSAATKEIRLAAKRSNSQGEVWKNVAVAQDKLSENVGTRVNSTASESSLQLAVENPRVRETADNYLKALGKIVDNQTDVIGYVFAINGQVNSADVYASSALFKKLWPKLLKASAIEAIADFRKDEKFEPVTKDNVRSFLSESEPAKPAEKDVTSRIKLVTRESDDSVLLETRDGAAKDEWVHRNYIKKN
jgi:hypothetical protein